MFGRARCRLSRSVFAAVLVLLAGCAADGGLGGMSFGGMPFGGDGPYGMMPGYGGGFGGGPGWGGMGGGFGDGFGGFGGDGGDFGGGDD